MRNGETQQRRSSRTFTPFHVPVANRSAVVVPRRERMGQVPSGRTIRLGLADEAFTSLDMQIVDAVRKGVGRDSV